MENPTISIKQVALKEPEIRIIENLALGRSARHIGEIMKYSPRTVETKIVVIKAKLGALNTPNIIAIAYELGIINNLYTKTTENNDESDIAAAAAGALDTDGIVEPDWAAVS